MKHQQYIRSVEGASTAILLIHGIAGTPAQFEDLIPLIPEDWTIYNMLLDGHGKTPKDFACSSMKKWEEQVSAAVEQLLSTHQHLLLVGHSMGTLHALQQVLDRPGKIDGLFLEAVPLYCRATIPMMWHCSLTALGIAPAGSRQEELSRYTSIDLQPLRLSYLLWFARFIELFGKSHRIRSRLLEVQVPCRCIQSRHDELVSRKSWKLLLKHPDFQVTELTQSGHFQYSSADLEFLKAQFREFIAQHQ